VESLPFFTKLVATVTSLEIDIGTMVTLSEINLMDGWMDGWKRGLDRSSAPKTLSFGEKTAKIRPADPEIIHKIITNNK